MFSDIYLSKFVQLDNHRNQLIQVKCNVYLAVEENIFAFLKSFTKSNVRQMASGKLLMLTWWLFVSAGASFECRNGGSGYLCSSYWNLWNEYSLYVDVRLQLRLQMGKAFLITKAFSCMDHALASPLSGESSFI